MSIGLLSFVFVLSHDIVTYDNQFFYYLISTFIFFLHSLGIGYCMINMVLIDDLLDYCVTWLTNNWNIDESIVIFDESIFFSRILFLERTIANWSSYALFIIKSFSLDTYDKSTRWVTSSCSTVCFIINNIIRMHLYFLMRQVFRQQS